MKPWKTQRPKWEICSVTNEGIAINPVNFGLQDFHIVKPWKTQHPKWEIYSVTNEGIAINPVNIGLQCTWIADFWEQLQRAEGNKSVRLSVPYAILVAIRSCLFIEPAVFSTAIQSQMPKNSTWSTPAKLGKIFALHYTAASFSSNFQVKMIDSDYSESEEDLGNGLKKRKIKLSDGEDKNVKGITDFCVV